MHDDDGGDGSGGEEGEREALFTDDAGVVDDYEVLEDEEDDACSSTSSSDEEEEEGDGDGGEAASQSGGGGEAPPASPSPRKEINVLGYRTPSRAALRGRRGSLRTGLLQPLAPEVAAEQAPSLVRRLAVGLLASGSAVEGRRRATVRCVYFLWGVGATNLKLLLHRASTNVQAHRPACGGVGLWRRPPLFFFLTKGRSRGWEDRAAGDCGDSAGGGVRALPGPGQGGAGEKKSDGHLIEQWKRKLCFLIFSILLILRQGDAFLLALESLVLAALLGASSSNSKPPSPTLLLLQEEEKEKEQGEAGSVLLRGLLEGGKGSISVERLVHNAQALWSALPSLSPAARALLPLDLRLPCAGNEEDGVGDARLQRQWQALWSLHALGRRFGSTGGEEEDQDDTLALLRLTGASV